MATRFLVFQSYTSASAARTTHWSRFYVPPMCWKLLNSSHQAQVMAARAHGAIACRGVERAGQCEHDRTCRLLDREGYRKERGSAAMSLPGTMKKRSGVPGSLSTTKTYVWVAATADGFI